MWVDSDGEHVLIDTAVNRLAHTYFDAPFGGPELERVILKIRPDRIVEHPPD